MNKNSVLFVFLMLLVCTAFAASDGWILFRSSTGFSVSYPITWIRNGVSSDRLQVRSSKGGAEGIGINKDQAEITVMDAPPESLQQTLAQVIEYYTRDATVISQRDVPGETIQGNCGNLLEVTSRESAIPPGDSPISVPTIINTDFFCEVNGRKVVAILRNWENDKKKTEYQNTALQIAKSIRISQN